MSGHSKWSTIKRQKGAADAKRGALFTKLARNISLAAREGGGGDPDMNFRLRIAIDQAKSNNMPQDSIQRAVRRGSGEGGEGMEDLSAVTYEGYAPGGGAILVQALTDNRNRTASEIRSAFNKGGGNLGEAGCVAWNFDSRGVITLEIDDETAADELSLAAIDADAEDVKFEDGILEVYTAPENLLSVKSALESEGAMPASADVAMVPKTVVPLENRAAEQTLRLLDILEELDDVQKAYTNADFPAEVLEQYGSA
ncbi:MAG: YebC/PmpR family DNA-binding transcriptional regulator [Chloroflexi bacterium]|nr:YebC/PmpR family DNA-binding transcriptional regulator [Chloroflexota bacterium]MYD48517.1 YebC/PmpR family DNA-binding transcriptional regulator [Chloroflexota bacterium]